MYGGSPGRLIMDVMSSHPAGNDESITLLTHFTDFGFAWALAQMIIKFGMAVCRSRPFQT